jgi:hypothetical protein
MVGLRPRGSQSHICSCSLGPRIMYRSVHRFCPGLLECLHFFQPNSIQLQGNNTIITHYFMVKITTFFIFHNFVIKINTFLGRVVAFFAEWWSGPTGRGRTLGIQPFWGQNRKISKCKWMTHYVYDAAIEAISRIHAAVPWVMVLASPNWHSASIWCANCVVRGEILQQGFIHIL